jgi:transcriptional regulator with XRE-family HTH domain
MTDASIGLGQAIREAREKKGISLRELARRLDVSAPYISDVEHGRRSFLRLSECAAILDVTEEWLIGRSEILNRKEIAWINSRPEIMELLRRWRAREDYPGPRRTPPPPRRGRR